MMYSPERRGMDEFNLATLRVRVPLIHQRIDRLRDLVDFRGNLIEEILYRYGHENEGGGPEVKLRKAEWLISKDLLMADFYDESGNLSRWGNFWTTKYGPFDVEKYKAINLNSNIAIQKLANILDRKIIYSRSAIIAEYLYKFSSKDPGPPILILPSAFEIIQRPPNGISVYSAEVTSDPYCGESEYVTIYKGPFHNLGHQPPPGMRKF